MMELVNNIKQRNFVQLWRWVEGCLFDEHLKSEGKNSTLIKVKAGVEVNK